MELTLKSGGEASPRRWPLLGFCMAVLMLPACAASARPLAPTVAPAQTGAPASLDSTFLLLLPGLLDDSRDPGNRAWPLLIDVESFAAAGSRFVGHELSRVEVAAALKHPFTPLLTAELTRAWEAGERPAAEHSIHLRLDSLEKSDARIVATMRVLYIHRAPNGSYDGDSTIYAITYERTGAGWHMVDRRVVLIT